MRLLIKQRVFSWTDSYDIYDEGGHAKYFVKAEFLALGHQLHVYDADGCEIGVIHQKLFRLLPAFEIEMSGQTVGEIQKEFTFFCPRYNIDFNGWSIEGNFMGWDYDVYDSDGRGIIHISKELLHWGDTYVIEFENPEDELMGMLLVIAIDAANCSN